MPDGFCRFLQLVSAFLSKIEVRYEKVPGRRIEERVLRRFAQLVFKKLVVRWSNDIAKLAEITDSGCLGEKRFLQLF